MLLVVFRLGRITLWTFIAADLTQVGLDLVTGLEHVCSGLQALTGELTDITVKVCCITVEVTQVNIVFRLEIGLRCTTRPEDLNRLQSVYTWRHLL